MIQSQWLSGHCPFILTNSCLMFPVIRIDQNLCLHTLLILTTCEAMIQERLEGLPQHPPSHCDNRGNLTFMDEAYRGARSLE